MTDQELKDLVASLAIDSKKTDEQMKRTNEKPEKLGALAGGIQYEFMDSNASRQKTK